MKQANPDAYDRMREAETNRRFVEKYGISLAEYNDMTARQHGVCAVCGGKNRNGRRLAVDHDHVSGNVRGLLCSDCNAGIGLFKESPEIMLSAMAYLRVDEK